MFSQRLGSVILDIFSNLNDSMILGSRSNYYRAWTNRISVKPLLYRKVLMVIKLKWTPPFCSFYPPFPRAHLPTSPLHLEVNRFRPLERAVSETVSFMNHSGGKRYSYHWFPLCLSRSHLRPLVHTFFTSSFPSVVCSIILQIYYAWCSLHMAYLFALFVIFKSGQLWVCISAFLHSSGSQESCLWMQSLSPTFFPTFYHPMPVLLCIILCISAFQGPCYCTRPGFLCLMPLCQRCNYPTLHRMAAHYCYL